MDIETIKEQICDVCHKMWQLGWVAANDGNVSALLEDGRLIEGESHIGVHHDGPKNGIVKLMVNPEKPKAVDGVPYGVRGTAPIAATSSIILYISIAL